MRLSVHSPMSTHMQVRADALITLLADLQHHHHATKHGMSSALAAPKTTSLCADLNYIYDDAIWSYDQLDATKA